MDEVCPQLLDLIPKEREWLVKTESSSRNHGVSEEKKLELRLGPPGVEVWTNTQDVNISKGKKHEHDSLLSLGNFSNGWVNNGRHCKANNGSSFLQQSVTVMGKESSQPCCSRPSGADAADKKKAFLPASVNTAVPNNNNTSQKRTAPAPVVGWPPIRSFRKNLASSTTAKQAPEPQNVVAIKAPIEKPVEISHKGLFVKINMDGVPIGRKVDLKAYDSYDKLSTAVDELFRGLLAAQKDTSAPGSMNNQLEEKTITGLLDGSGEYTLVYEDNEGDRMLVGDVPWHMFVSAVKRLRVLKSSELSKLCLGSKQEKIRFDGGLE